MKFWMCWISDQLRSASWNHICSTHNQKDKQKIIKKYFSLFFAQSNNAFGADKQQFFVGLHISTLQETDTETEFYGDIWA